MNRKSARDCIKKILSRLKKRYRGEMETSLDHSTPWGLLVATMLSAQSQDAQVNKVTPVLFRKYPGVVDYLGLRPSDLYPYVKTLGLYRNKAKNIIGAANELHAHYRDVVPGNMEDMLQLPGVGRKTANVVLSNAFGINSGIAVDTHCITTANRLFLFKTDDANKIERRLMEFVPKEDWGNVTHLLIALGRDVCTARAKHCEHCVLNDICPSSTTGKR